MSNTRGVYVFFPLFLNFKIDSIFVWYVWKFEAVILPSRWSNHILLPLCPLVSISTLFTSSFVIWQCSRNDEAISSHVLLLLILTDMKAKAFSLSGRGSPSSLACSMELRTQEDGWHSLIFLSKSDTLSLVNTLSQAFLGSKCSLSSCSMAGSLLVSFLVFLCLKNCRFLIWLGATSFFVPLFQPWGMLVQAGEM